MVLGPALLLALNPVNAAEEARLMERWLVNDALSTRTVDHIAWQKILDTYLIKTSAGTLFDFAGVTEEDIGLLDRYLRGLSRTDVDRLNETEQKAFWINAFNALSVRVVLSEYPVSSINDVGGGFFSSGPWSEKRFRVYLIDLSLNDIYHRILRPIWQDNRVHYALSCAAKGCPNLSGLAFEAETLDQALDAAARDFINNGKGILQLNGGSVRLSRLYDWYRDDFGEGEAGVIAHLKSFADIETGVNLKNTERISGHAFDWSLNDREESR
ncbi:MAG: DUF547 domain-containing protein [Alphaproteobacteria bacterium]